MRVLQHTAAACVRVAALASTARATRLGVVQAPQRHVSANPINALRNSPDTRQSRRSIAARAGNGGPAEDADTVDVTETVQVVAEEIADTAAAAAPEFAPRKKLVVLGGNGFVGSAVCREAVQMGLPVVSVNRSGAPQGVSGEWVNQVEWVRADVLDESSWSYCLEGAAAVVSCVGGFAPSPADMERICGDATIAGVEAAAAAGVPRFVFVSVHDYNIPGALKDQSGYFSGKRRAEDAVLSTFPTSGAVLRPGFIYGDRLVPELGVTVPLGVVGEPLQKLLALNPFQELTKTLEKLPASDVLLKPPVNVQSVAAMAVKCATAEAGHAPVGILSIEDIQTDA